MDGLKGVRREVGWLVAAISTIPVWVASRVDHRLLGEDPLITLTYAKNLARGAGFVFNHPPPLLGTTTPLFALLVAALGRLLPFASLTGIAVWLSAACWVAVLWMFVWFGRDFGLTTWQLLSAVAFVAVTGWVTRLEFEAYLFAALLVLSIGLFARGRSFGAGIATALLFLTRGEGLLLFPALAAAAVLADLRDDRGRPAGLVRSSLVRLTIGFAIPVFLWSAYALPTFGAILPNTLAAKIAQGASGLWKPFLHELWHVWLPGWAGPLAPRMVPAVSLAWVLVVVGAVVLVRRRSPLLVLVIWTLAYVAGYGVLGVAGYPWYAFPVTFTLSVLLGVGVGTVADLLARRTTKPAVAVAVGAVWVSGALAPFAASTLKVLDSFRPSPRRHAYYDMAAWFRARVSPERSIAYHEVGYLGYYTDNRIVDLLGLVTPGLAEHVAVGDFAWGFWQQRPDFLVYLEGSRFFEGILFDPRFPIEYRAVATLQGYDGKSLTVFERNGSR